MAAPVLERTEISEHHDHRINSPSSHPSSLPTPPGATESFECRLSPTKSAIRELSPSPSCSSLSSLPPLSAGAPSNSTGQPRAKRRKLTFAEKETKRLEKEASEQKKLAEKARREAEKEVKDRQKAEERAQKEEEKRQREIEKEQRRLAKEEKDKQKEAERQKKDGEKARRREEEEKKTKSQLRLNSFFVKPSGTEEAQQPPKGSESDSHDSKKDVITSIQDEDQASRSTLTIPHNDTSLISDYQKTFQPFFLQSHTTLAIQRRRSTDTRGILDPQPDWSLDNAHHNIEYDTLSVFQGVEVSKKRCRRTVYQVKDIVARLQGTSHEPIDLTDTDLLRRAPLDLLNEVPMKCLKFAEDVRPPYIGTFTQSLSARSATKLRRRPFARGLPRVNYDYDSEAEWEEPGEGEDLESEGEEEPEDEDDEEMSGFVDDGDVDELPRKRKGIVSDLESTCTGLCWEDSSGNVTAPIDLRPYTIMTIHEHHELPIDPFSTKYWQPPASKTEPTGNSTDRACDSVGNSSEVMPPPLRVPLSSISPSNARKMPPSNSDASKLNPSSGTGTAKSGLKSSASKDGKKVISPEVLQDFKAAVVGSDLTKAGLVEVLKKQFPKQSKDAIKDTLGLLAERRGRTESEKRWVLR